MDVEITPARRKMVTLPSGSVPLDNDVGTAPGVRISAGRTTIFCLPGVPAEM
jgi:nicotinamide-nucleotide amidase